MSGLASDLVRWYWEFGWKRRGAHRVLSNWLINAYECRARERSLGRDAERFGVALWGPSQAGKSTLLSSYIDHKNEPRSALMWDDTPFVFSETQKAREAMAGDMFGWAFNPFNGSNDASACVTRFHGADDIPHKSCPVQIHFADQRQVLHALAAGYISECKTVLPDKTERVWMVDKLREHLPPEPAKLTVNRDASELLMDAIYVVDRMIVEQKIRYQNLKASTSLDGNEWDDHLKDEILANPTLSSDRQRAMKFVEMLLWDGKVRLTEFFDNMILARKRIDKKFGSKRVFCSLPVAGLFLDMDTYGRLENVGQGNPEKRAYVVSAVSALSYREKENDILIEAANIGTNPFSSDCSFGQFQSLIWEISVPLNLEYLKQTAPDVAKFLAKADILDIPGVANEQKGDKDAQIDVLGDAKDSDFFLKILKRGKTASIVNRSAEEGRIDHLILLLRTFRHPSKPDQLATGINMIWKEIDSTYEAASKKAPPIPITLDLTFFNDIIHLVADSGASADLATISSRLAGLGGVIDPAVCRTFVTGYPQFREGRLTIHGPELDKAIDRVLKSSWAETRLPREEEFKSIIEMVQQGHEGGDGGVLYLLKSVENTLSVGTKTENVRRRLQRQEAELLRLVTTVAPNKDQNAERARELIVRMIQGITNELIALPATRSGKKRVTEVSDAMRRSFSFFPEELAPLPRSIDDILNYVDTQIAVWIENKDRGGSLATLGVSQIDRIALLEAISRIIDRTAVVVMLSQIRRNIRNPESEYLKYATRFVATVFNNQLRGGQSYVSYQPRNLTHDDFVNYCNEYFPKWIDSHGNASDSPHFQMIIRPGIQRLHDLSKHIGAGQREDLPGDAEMSSMLDKFNGVNGGTVSPASPTPS